MPVANADDQGRDQAVERDVRHLVIQSFQQSVELGVARGLIYISVETGVRLLQRCAQHDQVFLELLGGQA